MSSYKKLPRKSNSSRSGGYSGTGTGTVSSRFTPSSPSFPFRNGDPNSASTVSTRNNGNAWENTEWENLLGNGRNSDFAAFLASLGIQMPDGKEMSESAIKDWNKQLMDAQLNHAITQENRNYNEGLRDEQRIYDSPTNQLARLMGAGISRDAAIQLLSGTGAGGSSVPYSEPAAETQGLLPSESQKNALESKLGIANTVFGGVSALTSLVNLGFSIPQSLAQTSYLKAQAFMSNADAKAFNGAGRAYSVLKGINASADAFSSLSSATKAITDAANNGNEIAAQFVNSGGIADLYGNAPLSSKHILDTYKADNEGVNWNKQYFAATRRMEAEADFAELNITALGEEINKTVAEYEKIVSDTQYTYQLSRVCEKQSKVLEAQAKLLEKQGLHEDSKRLLTQAQTLKTKSETKTIDLENNVTEALQTGVRSDIGSDGNIINRTGLEWMTYDALNKLVTDARISAKQTSPAYVDAAFRETFNTHEAIATAMSLDALANRTGLMFARLYPSQFQLWTAIKKLGGYEYLSLEIQDAAVMYNREGNIINALRPGK